MSTESKVWAVIVGGGESVIIQVSPRTAKILRAIQSEVVKLSRESEWLRGEVARQQKRLDEYSWRDNPGQGMY